MEIEITGTPKFHFAVRKEDLVVLMTLSQHHYDGHCRSYSKTAAEVGVNGLLVIWGMYFKYRAEDADPDAVEVSADWRDLDTLLKCMEMPQCLQTEDELVRVSKLRKAFSQALSVANAQQKGWVHKFDSEPAPAAAISS